MEKQIKMRTFDLPCGPTKIHVQVDGPNEATAPTLVLSGALGTTLGIWDKVVALLPAGLRIIRYDLRGHGGSGVPEGPYSMGTLVSEAAAVCDALSVKEAMFIGLSVGGMIGQGLAVKRPDLIRALVLSNTAAKIGNPSIWRDRIDVARSGGMSAVATATIPRWFGSRATQTSEAQQMHAMLSKCDPIGYAGVCAAISGTDFYTPTSGLRIPALGIAGADDGSTPADLVRETVDLIPGSQFQIMRRSGHIPCVQDPSGFADHIKAFVAATGHMVQGL